MVYNIKRGLGEFNPYEPAPGQEAGALEALSIALPFMRGVPAMGRAIMPYGIPSAGRAIEVPSSVAADVNGAAINGTIHNLPWVAPVPVRQWALPSWYKPGMSLVDVLKHMDSR